MACFACSGLGCGSSTPNAGNSVAGGGGAQSAGGVGGAVSSNAGAALGGAGLGGQSASAGSGAGAGGASAGDSSSAGAAIGGAPMSSGLSFEPGALVWSVSLSVNTAGVLQDLKLHNAGPATPLTSLSVMAGAPFVLEAGPPLPLPLAAGQELSVSVRFLPDANAAATTAYAGSLRASAGGLSADAGLFGLAMDQANNEPSLAQVVATLGYAVDIGSSSTALGTSGALLGDELGVPRFAKAAGAGPVGMLPVARYAPFESAPYGYYLGPASAVTRHMLGAMAKGDADNVANRTLFPPLDAGSLTSFDPGAESFGIFAESASNTASLGPDGRLYQEDALNDDQAGVLPVHRVRVYALKDRLGKSVPDAFLAACEEANNSDYQDYVFVMTNVQASSP